jgi:Flp pilus assembly protein TadG
MNATTHLLRPTGRRNGMVLIYAMILMVVLLAIGSVAVDWGRVQLAKTQLVGGADAAARAGAAGLSRSPADAIDAARWTAQHNVVDGTALDLQSADVQVGIWDDRSLAFTALVGSDQFRANAVRVVAVRNAARGSAVPLSFASIFGNASTSLRAESIATIVGGVKVDQPVAATANPFLAGMHAGSVASANNPHHNADYAGTTANPKQSPTAVNLPLIEGAALTFDSIDGVARHDPTLTDSNPDGQLSDIGHNNPTPDDGAAYGTSYSNENGIADVRAPINALVGVFLSDEEPSLTKAPKNLDFSTDASRDFHSLQPKVKQIFFIGDGLDSHGQQQEFIVPKGATRLYVATWDFYEWNNNAGTRTVKVNRPQQIVMVK